MTTHVYSEKLSPKSKSWRVSRCSCGWRRQVNGAEQAYEAFKAHLRPTPITRDRPIDLPIDPTGRNWGPRHGDDLPPAA